jgi:uncharacterized protein YkwD
VRHRPASRPLVTRTPSALTRWALLTRRSTRSRSARLALGAMFSTVIASFVLAVPVVSGAGAETSSGVFTSFASSPATRGSSSDSPVVMGVDGDWASSDSDRPAARKTTPRAHTPKATPRAHPKAAPKAPRTPKAAPKAPVTTAPAAAGSTAPDTTAPDTSAKDPSAEAPPVVETQAPVEEAAETAVSAPAPAEAAAPTPTQAAAPRPPANTSTEGQVLALVNAARADHGCGALAADAGLAAVARAHSADMRDSGYFGHTNLAGLDPFDRAAAAGLSARAENIARGQDDAAAVMNSWMNSSGHRANILNCSLTKLGVGVAEGSGGPWWTQLFA